MRDSKIVDFLTQLADKVPAPGGGATAALHAAQAAALLGMVARYSTGERYADHAETVVGVIGETDALRTRALKLAEEDAAAFTAVSDAYRLPKGEERSAAIARALSGAAEPPVRVVEAATRLVGLCELLLPIGNRNVVTDVAAAAEAARAALTTARVNVEVNLRGIKDERVREELNARLSGVDAAVARADWVTAEVREEITR
ncbi:MAG: cyclodeaminase/cyclohydrolase family protein [Nonomuraea sp.]|nr:cyclodeaminase/cyclohydrolase family protein [Nonomuraea sp.]NUP66154.1 cyclodeaminase/cyclohydrolase family protein [Nonomuraea sp.]NUP81424.1 cyclodeaminase/cyclohydrolase family protein [Nonomuraea sp.]NUS02878.1 cyclodeaminase/cyclohydrolase family protein [Nonomuraea sp.]NUT43505.1 cyclodeaminase/cyclohydrolase family protein [Thermoactinospora sp.]